jgi:regulator of replication initiation timing
MTDPVMQIISREMEDAEAEIERLTTLLTERREAVTHWKTQLNEARAENDRLRLENLELRAAIHGIAAYPAARRALEG